MSNNVEQLKTEINDIKKSLNELKNNINISEVEKKTQAKALKSKADVTKQKVENEIKSLESATDDESKKKKEEAKTLLDSFNEITTLYGSVMNTGSTDKISGQPLPEQESKNIFSKTKDWIGGQWSDVWDEEKWKTEKGMNLLRTAGFVATGIGAVSLAYKGIKKLFGSEDENDEESDEEDNEEKEDKEKEENDRESSEKIESSEKTESSEKEKSSKKRKHSREDEKDEDKNSWRERLIVFLIDRSSKK